MLHEESIAGSTALVTGASSGIGEACARAFARAGVNLILWARRRDRLQEIADELSGSYPVRVRWDEVDVRSLDTVRRAASLLDAAPDILVNNAGLARGTDKLFAASTDDWDEMIDTNLKGLLYVTRSIVPLMLAAERSESALPATVVNIGSTAGIAAYPGGGVYCATKSGAKFAADGLRLDTVDRRFRVCTVQPGMVDTEFSKVRFHGDESRAKAVYDQLVPLCADDVADAVLWAATRSTHVQVAEITLMPLCQASGTVIHRGPLV